MHLHDEADQATMVGSVTSNNIGHTSKHVVAVLHAASRIIETICVSVKTPLYPRDIASG